MNEHTVETFKALDWIYENVFQIWIIYILFVGLQYVLMNIYMKKRYLNCFFFLIR